MGDFLKCARDRKGIRSIFLNQDEEKAMPSKSIGSVATQANLETLAKASGRVLFSF